MAIKGIDLSPDHEQHWLQKNNRNLGYLMLTILLSFGLALAIFTYSSQIEQQSKQHQLELQNAKTKLNQLTQRISHLKNNVATEKPIYLEKAQLTNFITYLNHFPISGQIEISQLYYEQNDSKNQHTKIRIAGKSESQTDFEKVTQQLKQRNLSYKIEHFQRTENNQLDFSLIITFRNTQ